MILFNLKTVLSHLVRSYTGEVSMLVNHYVTHLRNNPQGFELVRSGRSLFVQRKNDEGFGKVRLNPWGLSLSLPMNDHVELTPKESRLLNRALHRYLQT